MAGGRGGYPKMPQAKAAPWIAGIDEGSTGGAGKDPPMLQPSGSPSYELDPVNGTGSVPLPRDPG